MTDWCILRCAPSQTLNLASSLTEAGFDVWTPRGPIIRRAGTKRTRKEVVTALIPRFVFAQADQRDDLITLSRAPSLQYRVWDSDLRKMVTRGHPSFSLFRNGAHRPITDADLAALRRAEVRPKPQRVERTFNIGDLVRTDDGGFAGLTGEVVAVRGPWVTVQFPRWDITPEFGSWLLRPIDGDSMVNVQCGATEQALSAEAV